MTGAFRGAILASLLLNACQEQASAEPRKEPTPSAAMPVSTVDASVTDSAHEAFSAVKTCPPDMTKVKDTYCVDRFETSMADADQSRTLSPYYPPHPWHARDRFGYWTDPDYNENEGALKLTEEDDRTTKIIMDFPPLPAWQIKTTRYRVLALSHRDVIPNAYISYYMAKEACEHSGKRLCTNEEWLTACRGEEDREFPYGNEFRDGICNVRRQTHPALRLYGRTGYFMSDPRYNLITEPDGRPLLEKTGRYPECRSRWGDDGIYDMVGNLAEWVEDGSKGPRGTFRGGFYSLYTPKGCGKDQTGHSKKYYDYSIGARCCMDAGQNIE